MHFMYSTVYSILHIKVYSTVYVIVSLTMLKTQGVVFVKQLANYFKLCI